MDIWWDNTDNSLGTASSLYHELNLTISFFISQIHIILFIIFISHSFYEITSLLFMLLSKYSYKCPHEVFMHGTLSQKNI